MYFRTFQNPHLSWLSSSCWNQNGRHIGTTWPTCPGRTNRRQKWGRPDCSTWVILATWTVSFRLYICVIGEDNCFQVHFEYITASSYFCHICLAIYRRYSNSHNEYGIIFHQVKWTCIFLKVMKLRMKYSFHFTTWSIFHAELMRARNLKSSFIENSDKWGIFFSDQLRMSFLKVIHFKVSNIVLNFFNHYKCHADMSGQ